MVFPTRDQKAARLVKLLTEDVIPFCGVPEALLSDRGANLLSHLMTDVCKLLGIKKLNTTSYHPECDGMVEWFKRTLKSALRKHAVNFGDQWDTYLSGIMWAYRNSPHDSTGEKPSFLLFGVDCCSPSEAALLKPQGMQPTDVSDYREQLVLSLSSACDLATQSIRKAQHQYKTQYDKKSSERKYQVGDWVLVSFPQEESRKSRKLSRPWHGPYRVNRCLDPDVIVSKVYYPEHGEIQVHQSRVTPCPPNFPSGYYWYGKKRHSPGRPPKWLDSLFQEDGTTSDKPANVDEDDGTTQETGDEHDEDDLDMDDDPNQEDLDSSPKQSLPRTNTRYSLRSRASHPQCLMYIDTQVELP